MRTLIILAVLQIILLTSNAQTENKSIRLQSDSTSLENLTWLNPIVADKVLPKFKEFPIDTIDVELEKYEQLNDSVVYIIYQFGDGVCTKGYILSLKNKQPFMEKPIEYYCDMDLSNTRNNYTTYETTEKPHFFLVTDYTEKADPKKINSKGVYKKGYDWLNVETHTDSVQRIIQVDETGWLVDRDIVR